MDLPVVKRSGLCCCVGQCIYILVWPVMYVVLSLLSESPPAPGSLVALAQVLVEPIH